jgi:hypothetical protein
MGFLVLWLGIAALLYIPFRKWVATAESPLIAALLWPVFLTFVVLAGSIVAIKDRFEKK